MTSPAKLVSGKMSITPSKSARGGNRGGCIGGWERTSETYDEDKLKRLKREYQELDPAWKETFLEGLSRYERAYVRGQVNRD